MGFFFIKRKLATQVAHACNPSYSGGSDQKDCSSKPAWANSSRPYHKKTLHKKGLVYPYLNQQNPLFLPIIAYTLSTTKLEIRAK
jgi:hypothetical protein